MNVFSKSGKCNYCELAFPLVIGKPDEPDNDDFGIAIHHPNYLSAYGYDIHGSGSNAVSVMINYCPMCGRKLDKGLAYEKRML